MGLAFGTNCRKSSNSFCPKLRGEKNYSRYVTTWSVEASNVAERDRIATNCKHDWDCRGRRLSGADGEVAAGCCEHCHMAANQFGREHWQAIVLTIRITIYDRDVLALDIASFF